ncbi:MAG: insulinase family protein [Deltaproteobacteria bacterium]|nr:insulinase family protein [Deltaproteobacteria bacterium]
MLRTLDNGLRVVLLESRGAPVVAAQVWVNVGSADAGDGPSGLAHVLEHMVFKGTKRRAAGDAAREIEAAGGDFNAWTSFDQTVFHVVMASRFFGKGLEVLADAVLDARIDAEALDKELKVILEEIKEGEDAPGRVLSQELFATAFRRHPYRLPVIGRAEQLRKLTAREVAAFHRRHYTPANMTLVLVGDFEAKSALARVRRLFGRPGGAAPERVVRAEEPEQRRLRVAVRARAQREVHFSLAFHVPPLKDPDTPALDLAAILLGQGERSRLVRKVQREQQLVSSVYAYAFTPRNPGLLVIGATAEADRVVDAVRAICSEVFALAREEVPTAELERAQTVVESDAVYQRETAEGLARRLGTFQVVVGDLTFDEEYQRRVAHVTPAGLRAVASRYLRPERLTVAVLGPKSTPRLVSELEAAATHAGGAAARAAAKDVRSADPVARVTLANGARLVVLRDSTAPLVAFRAAWAGGMRYESEATAGITTLLGELLGRGTATRSASQLREAFDAMAGDLGGYAGRNSFGLRAEVLSRHWERALELLSDCLLAPAFPEAELERERRELLAEVRAREENLGALTVELLLRKMFRRHPLRLPALGTVRSISRLGRDQLARHYRRHYHPSQLVLAVVGDVDPAEVARKFETLFGAVARRAAPEVAVPKESGRHAPETAVSYLRREQAHLAVGYPGTTLDHRDRFTLEVLTQILGGSGGRLYAELRDRKGIAYRVNAFSEEGIDPGYVAVYAAMSPENLADALRAVEREVARLREELVPAAELKRAQRYLVGVHEISLQRKANLATHLALHEAHGLGYRAYRDYPAGIQAVTAEELRRAARRYLDERGRVVALIKPEEMSPAAEKRLGPVRQAGVVTGPSKSAVVPARAAKRVRKGGRRR